MEAQAILADFAASQKYILIIAIGLNIAPSVQIVAAEYPNQKFALIGGSVNADNVASSEFATEQAAFIGGVLAAFLSSGTGYNKTVGILAAVDDDPEINKMIAGFILGLQEANETYGFGVTLLDTRYINAVNDTDTAKDMTADLFLVDNASIVFVPVRANIIGVRQGMELADTTRLCNETRRPLVIAAEFNLDYYGNKDPNVGIGPSWIATSVVPRSDLAIYKITNKTMWNEFPAGVTFNYNLANGGVNITDFEYSSTYINAYAMGAMKSYIAMILNGTIVIDV